MVASRGDGTFTAARYRDPDLLTDLGFIHLKDLSQETTIELATQAETYCN